MQVLIVDDSDVIRERVATCLGAIPGVDSVRQASTGAHALECISAAPPDLLVLDLQMPRINGLTVLDIVRLRVPPIPVIVLTHHPEYREYALRRGAAYVFDKATQIGAMCAIIASMASAAQAAL